MQTEETRNKDEEILKKRWLNKRALEVTCYVCGAGAFGVFIRWLQLMLAFNDDGLVDASIFNVLVPLMVIASGYVFLRFVDNFRADLWYVSDDYYEAFYNPGKIFSFLRWAIGMLMVIGSIVLLISSETDKDVTFMRILALLGALTGIAFPIGLSCANKPHATSIKTVCWCCFLPILMYCMWLVTCYKSNSINSVVWDYGPEAVAIILSIIAFFRVAGFPFGSPNAWRTMFFCMLAAAVNIMIIADTRYIGMQIMFFAGAMMLVLYNWIFIVNMSQGEAPEEVEPDDGFERLQNRRKPKH